MIVCCVALLVTFWVRGSQKEYGLFQLLRGEMVPIHLLKEAEPPATQVGPKPSAFTPGNGAPVDRESTALRARLSRETEDLAAAVVPSVVSIETQRPVPLGRVIRSPLSDRDLMIPERGVEPGQGSGVFISEEGHVVTNHHVIDQAEAIRVTTADRGQFAATVIGFDPVADIAVLKLTVEPDTRFPPLRFGDSDKVRQGAMVFSVGSPFGLDGTFTDGVISSAVPRRISDSTPPLFQTNTVLNQGNSGGPLVDVRGDIIGINSAIYSGSDKVAESASAYGLAIPSNNVSLAVEQILNQDVPSYGYLGVYLKEIYPHDVFSLGLRNTEGCFVNGTLAGSPAYRAGLLKDDVIKSFHGQTFSGIQELVHLIQSTAIGTPVELVVVRERKEMGITAVIRDNGSVEIPEPTEALISESWERTGIKVGYVTASERKRKGYEPSHPMVEIEEIRPGSIAKKMGLYPGLLIHRVDQRPTQTPREFYELIHERPRFEVTQDRQNQPSMTLEISRPGRRASVRLQMPLS